MAQVQERPAPACGVRGPWWDEVALEVKDGEDFITEAIYTMGNLRAHAGRLGRRDVQQELARVGAALRAVQDIYRRVCEA